MDENNATEIAYKNGYGKGYDDGKRDAVPCKMGDTAWGIKRFNHDHREVRKGKVNQMYFGDDMRLCICVKNICRGEWGVNVFATKEDAEKALAELQRERREVDEI
jgi:hypothetical protein